MNIIVDYNHFLNNLSFWYNKTDDECIELATGEYGVDCQQALLNILQRDFWTQVINDVVEELIKIYRDEKGSFKPGGNFYRTAENKTRDP